MKVLLVEDSRPMRAMQRSVLAQFGDHAIEESRSAADALGAVHRDAPDLMILDRDIPGMDALALIGACRAANKSTRIIVLARELDDAFVEAAFEAGAGAVLEKPFTPDLLSQRIEESSRGSSCSAA